MRSYVRESNNSILKKIFSPLITQFSVIFTAAIPNHNSEIMEVEMPVFHSGS